VSLGLGEWVTKASKAADLGRCYLLVRVRGLPSKMAGQCVHRLQLHKLARAELPGRVSQTQRKSGYNEGDGDEKQEPKLESKQVETSNEQTETSRSRKPGTFTKGDSRINRTKGPVGKREKTPSLLRDMRWVYGHAEGEDRTQGQKHCRAWLKEDPKGFLSQTRVWHGYSHS
jgi:hypothetical protein